ncbi:amidohydrolase 2 [Infundibulicybe gibba]|nr:amidohydrolase 2 [Infundibulicybe gibba]
MHCDLVITALRYPAIDNHAHPLLQEENRGKIAFEGLISEASGDALQDAVHTLACLRATRELQGPLALGSNATWDDIKAQREKLSYLDLCNKYLAPARIQCILIDDGLGSVEALGESVEWHDQFTSSPSRRIVRVEVVAESILEDILKSRTSASSTIDIPAALAEFDDSLEKELKSNASDPRVAGFKSIACYRTGLNISVNDSPTGVKLAFVEVIEMFKEQGKIRLAHKHLNDHIVRLALGVAGKYEKPVQFHTGLGDNDITLALSSPAQMQSIIAAYPETTFVLLHSSYPYTRDAGYLTAVYPNVYLDFGEVFPFVSGRGQLSILEQVLELSPTNKIMWSTDGHWWPESYYLGSIQARKALSSVLCDIVDRGQITEAQAVTIVQNALFHNANRVYNLGLTPHLGGDDYHAPGVTN